MPDKATSDCLDDDEERCRALWEPVIARFRESGDASECEEFLASGVSFPNCLFRSFLSVHHGKRLYKKTGRKEKPETFDEAIRVVEALHEARRIRDTEGIDFRDAIRRVSAQTGIDEEKLWRLQEGDGTKKEKIVLRQMKDSYRTKHIGPVKAEN